MHKTLVRNVFLAAALGGLGQAGPALAYYNGAATLDPGGNNAQATAFAAVNCFNNGNGDPHHFSAAVQDLSAPSPGLLVSLHIFKDTQMTTVTDPASGDGNDSPFAIVAGGAGTYYLSIRKTDLGARNFNVAWECQTIDNVGTGTGISVLQIQ